MKYARFMSNITSRLNPARLNLKGKILMALLSNLLIALLIVLFLVWFKQKKLSVSSAYETLSLVENIKKQHIEDELNRFKTQLQLFAKSSRTINAFNSLLQGFSDLEYDNYYLGNANSYEEIRKELEDYYTTRLLPQIEEKKTVAPDLEDFLSEDPKQTILQFLYLAANTKSLTRKYETTGAGDGSLYSGVHVQHQSWLLNYARKNRISDLYFIDAKSGYIFYSLKKYPDFGTNLFTGSYKNSKLSRAFRNAISSSKESVLLTDMDRRIPGIIPPCFYFSTPVVQGNQTIGAIVFSVEADYLDNLLLTQPHAENDWATAISTMIIGTDRFFRSNDPDFLSDQNRYLKKLKYRTAGDNIAVIDKSSCTVMNLQVQGNVFANASLGIAGKGKYVTPSGKSALCSYTPLNINGLDWILISQFPVPDVLRPVRSLLIFMIIFYILLILILIWLISFFSNDITLRVANLNKTLTSLADNKENDETTVKLTDELDIVKNTANNIIKRIGEAARFATELTEGKTDSAFAVTGDNDLIGISLNKLRDNMIKTKQEEDARKVEDDIRNWTTHGIAMFNDILRQDNNDIQKLSYNIIRNLIQYLSANQGGFFLMEDSQTDGQYLSLVAAYAYDRQKFLKKRIKVGEDLIGNCVLEKQSIYLKDIPEDYIEIRSGLGGAVPRSLLIVPLKKEDQITGAIEIASFNEFRKHEIDFVEKVAESIAATLVTVKLHEQTALLLEESKKRSEEISQQEEELRQNLEELKATQEEMARIRKEEEQKEKARRESELKMMEQLKEQQQLLSKEKSLLDALLNNVPESIYFKDLKSRFIRFSASMLKLFKLNKPEELLGKSDFDMFDEEHSRPAYEDEQKIIRTGKPMVDKVEKEVLPDGRVNYVNTTKMPLRDENNNIIGTFGISKDVTNFVNLQQEIKAKENIIKGKNEEIKRLQEEIRNLKKGTKKQ